MNKKREALRLTQSLGAKDYSAVTEASPDAVIIIDDRGTIIFVNHRAEVMFGYDRGTMISNPIGNLVPERLRAEHNRYCADYFADPRTMAMGDIHAEIIGRRQDGSEFSADISLSPLETEAGLVVVNAVRDVTERKNTEAALKEALAKYRGLVEQSLVGTYIIQDGKFAYVNPKLAEIFGYTRDEIIESKTVADLTAEADRGLVAKNIAKRVAGKVKSVNYEFRGLRRDGSIINVEVYGSTIELAGRPAIIGSLLDISARKRAERAVRHMAYHDPLTGLPNRRLFNDHLKQALAVARRHEQMLALVFLDLDHFKRINDALGHEIGDLLLRAVARRLKSNLRRADTAARLGGDEFIIMLADIVKPTDAAILTEKILDILAKPFNLSGHRIYVSATAGISLYPTDGDDARTLQNHADAGLHRAKETGPNVYQFYTPRMSADARARMAIENGLRGALHRGELILYYQPCVDLRSERIIGMEALLRWRRPDKGLVRPAEFISIAEDTGLIVPIGEWAIQTAARQNKAWLDAGLGHLRVMVNLSARQFHERGLADTVTAALKDVGLDAWYLVLEITESLLMKNAGETAAVLYELKESGVDILMDDFGVGYSSLGSLKLFPIDALKIDRSFVRDAGTSPDDAAIIKAIIAIAQKLKLSVIAEGVETPAQLAFLRSLKCEAMQGFIYSRPLPAAEFEKLLREGRRLPEAG